MVDRVGDGIDFEWRRGSVIADVDGGGDGGGDRGDRAACGGDDGRA